MRKPLFLSTEIHTRACKEREVMRLLLFRDTLCAGVYTICGFVLAYQGAPFLSEVTTLPPTLRTVLFPTSSLPPLSQDKAIVVTLSLPTFVRTELFQRRKGT